MTTILALGFRLLCHELPTIQSVDMIQTNVHVAMESMRLLSTKLSHCAGCIEFTPLPTYLYHFPFWRDLSLRMIDIFLDARYHELFAALPRPFSIVSIDSAQGCVEPLLQAASLLACAILLLHFYRPWARYTISMYMRFMSLWAST
jgi:hypothetical protein